VLVVPGIRMRVLRVSIGVVILTGDHKSTPAESPKDLIDSPTLAILTMRPNTRKNFLNTSAYGNHMANIT